MVCNQNYCRHSLGDSINLFSKWTMLLHNQQHCSSCQCHQNCWLESCVVASACYAGLACCRWLGEFWFIYLRRFNQNHHLWCHQNRHSWILSNSVHFSKYQSKHVATLLFSSVSSELLAGEFCCCFSMLYRTRMLRVPNLGTFSWNSTRWCDQNTFWRVRRPVFRKRDMCMNYCAIWCSTMAILESASIPGGLIIHACFLKWRYFLHGIWTRLGFRGETELFIGRKDGRHGEHH